MVDIDFLIHSRMIIMQSVCDTLPVANNRGIFERKLKNLNRKNSGLTKKKKERERTKSFEGIFGLSHIQSASN